MLKIPRAQNGELVLTLSGQMDTEYVIELTALLSTEASDGRIALDLRDLTLVGQDAVSFLRDCEADGIQLEELPGIHP
jgi:anti-anti-sigma regulatory factor